MVRRRWRLWVPSRVLSDERARHPCTSTGGGRSHMPATKSKIRGFSSFYQTKPTGRVTHVHQQVVEYHTCLQWKAKFEDFFLIFTKPNQSESEHHPRTNCTSAGGGISHRPAMKSKIRGFFLILQNQTKPRRSLTHTVAPLIEKNRLTRCLDPIWLRTFRSCTLYRVAPRDYKTKWRVFPSCIKNSTI